MKTKQYILITFAFASMILSSCEDVIDINLNTEDTSLYAIEARITTEGNPYVWLYKSEKVNSVDEYTGVSGATVTFSDDSEPPSGILLEESPDNPGYYQVPESEFYVGETGKNYTLTIETGDVVISANDRLEPVEPIDSIQVRPSLRGDKRFLGIFTYGKETPGIGDYYKWDIYINDSLLNNVEYMFIASDELVDGNYVYNLEIFTDFHNPDEPDERVLNLGDTIYVKQTSLTKFAYNFYYRIIDQSYSGGMFSVPKANAVGNFTSSDGKTVLGMFSANDISTSNKVIIDEKINNQLKD